MDNEPALFDLPPSDPKEAARTFKRIEHPIWSENKAQLIGRYLKLFVWVTKHGTYIDAFAGPQQPDKSTMWSAKIVLENRPRWLRHFHLFEMDEEKVKLLNTLKKEQPPHEKGESKRSIDIYAGDCNIELPKLLKKNPLTEREATFCLLDQRTRECDWATVVELATHKKKGNKIEIFYFLANRWFDRAIGSLKHPEEKMERWWGNSEWKKLCKMPNMERSAFLQHRFKTELNYKEVYPGFPRFASQINVIQIH